MQTSYLHLLCLYPLPSVPKFVSGLSGTELVWEVLNRTKKNVDLPSPQTEYDYSPEYWCGWILAFYQWNTGKSFKKIKEYLPMSEIYKLYPLPSVHTAESFVVLLLIFQRTPWKNNKPAARRNDHQSRKQHPGRII